MCGICGVIDRKRGSLNSELILGMANKMAHRGPDDRGVYANLESTPRVALGHRRLSIIDLSKDGHQPMTNEDKSVWLVLNGEIYNYRTLRSELEKKGHMFKSNTDTEVVIHLYEEYGEDCVRHMRGMFAFAIWDEKRKTLTAGRDRTGQKPFLYYCDNDRFVFASEFASLVESGLIKKEINPKAIDHYLTFGYIPAPLTIYKNVLKLPPAHVLTFKDGKVNLKCYWNPDYSRKTKISEKDASHEILRLLKEAVKLRLRSDVPLGAFLSGGIDSSTIVALMSEISGEKVKTFSIGFEEKDYNELKYARNIADKFGTEHHELIVKPDALGVLPLLVERYGEPYADSSSIPTYYVCNQTRRFVTVALSGDGGDELFAGYERYPAMLVSEVYQKMPGMFKGLAKGLMRTFPDSTDPKNKLRRIKRFSEGLDMEFNLRYLRWVSIFNNKLKNELYSNSFKDRASGNDPLSYLNPYIGDTGISSRLDRLLATDTHTYLPDDLLVKVDIASMANSLEVRSPFLDHKLIEFVASLPAEYKMKGIAKKYLLKKTMKGIVPSEIINRRKMGFGLPVGKWFRNELKDFLQETLLSKDSLDRGYFKKDVLKGMIGQHVSEKRDFTFQLWALLMLEMWHKRYS